MRIYEKTHIHKWTQIAPSSGFTAPKRRIKFLFPPLPQTKNVLPNSKNVPIQVQVWRRILYATRRQDNFERVELRNSPAKKQDGVTTHDIGTNVRGRTYIGPPTCASDFVPTSTRHMISEMGPRYEILRRPNVFSWFFPDTADVISI